MIRIGNLKSTAWTIIAGILIVRTILIWLRYFGYVVTTHTTDIMTEDLVPRPVAWLPDKDMKGDNHCFKHFLRISEVLRMSGYYFGNESSPWTIMHGRVRYMNKDVDKVPIPNPTQKINMIPGLRAMTDKTKLLSSNITGMLPSFHLPKQRNQFTKYIEEHPDKMWLVKDNQDGGYGTNLIKRNKDIIKLSMYKTAVQEFVKHPFLVHGRKLQIAIHAVITSVNPLRVHLINRDWTVLLHGVPYYPFDPQHKNSYIMHWSWLFLRELPPFRDLYKNYGFTQKELLLQYLKQRGADAERVEANIRQQIRQVFVESESKIMNESNHRFTLPNLRSYYETVRFDFIFDRFLYPVLCEVQGPPGMIGETKSMEIRYKRILYDILKLNNLLASRSVFSHNRSRLYESHLSADQTLCEELKCSIYCTPNGCDLCESCMSEDDKTILYQTYTEFILKSDLTCILPEPFKDPHDAAVFLDRNREIRENSLSYKNTWLRRWFAVRCVNDDFWCF